MLKFLKIFIINIMLLIVLILSIEFLSIYIYHLECVKNRNILSNLNANQIKNNITFKDDFLFALQNFSKNYFNIADFRKASNPQFPPPRQ